MQLYNEGFFQYLQEGSKRSAEQIVPILLELIQPQSMIDVGCGTGTWLSVFREHGVEDIWGVDGDYVQEHTLEIPKDRFLAHDLAKPLTLDRQFDLAMSLEVAEHLPADSAEAFVDSLTQLAPMILFSAAIPLQGGVGHINEQWQDYWAAFFQQKGYMPIDCIRKKIWQNNNVEYWYAQNILLFLKQDYLERQGFERLQEEFKNTNINQLSLVHPRKYLEAAERCVAETKAAQWYASQAEKYAKKADPTNMSLKKFVSSLPIVVTSTLKRKLFS